MITLEKDIRKDKPEVKDPFKEEVKEIKVDDKVVCIDDYMSVELVKGRVYTVEKKLSGIVKVKGNVKMYNENRFELVEEKPKESKYKAKKVEVDSIVFDSTAEADYYIYLKEQKELGNVKAFRVQPKFTLLPPFQTEDLVTYKGTSYISDFEVMHADGSIEVIDIKGFATPMSKVKKKLFHYFYPNIKLTWLVKNAKWGGENGFIEYNKLEQIRSKNRREKKKNEKDR